MPSRKKSVTVIGAGPMGSVLARTLAQAGVTTTVWNRTASKAHALAESGCLVAETSGSAVAASDLVILNVASESAIDEILFSATVQKALSGKVVVNLSTVAKESAERFGYTIRECGGQYMSGGILSYPRSIGHDHAVIVYSGRADIYAECSTTLKLLAGNQRHVGDGDGDAAVVYTASWVFYYGGLAGFLQAAAYMHACGVDPTELGALAPTIAGELLGGAEDAIRRVAANDYSGEQGPVKAHPGGIGVFVESLHRAGVDAAVTQAFVQQCLNAVAAGYGDQDISALFNALQTGRENPTRAAASPEL